MGSLIRLLSGTSQGASPVTDSGTRAAIIIVVNAVTQYILDAFSADAATRGLVATIENPLIIIAFGLLDKLDGMILAQRGIQVAPSATVGPPPSTPDLGSV